MFCMIGRRELAPRRSSVRESFMVLFAMKDVLDIQNASMNIFLKKKKMESQL